jgi:leucyl/phenylalanyl-tRNA---protein transferase
MTMESQQEIPNSLIKIKIISFKALIRRTSRRIYRFFLKRIVLKLFLDSERALEYVYNEMPKTAPLIVSRYASGWVLFGENSDKLVWKTFSERAIITAETVHIANRLRGYMRRDEYEIRCNTNFTKVIQACQRQGWTWLNAPAIDIYSELNEMGFIDTYEAYKDGELVGGLWGIVVGNTFGIMSMFHHADRAGAIALGTLVEHLSEGKYEIVDCGELNSNFARYGAENIPKEEFIKRVVLQQGK